MIDFSIIIPAKNEEVNISRCLESISNIEYPAERYEVILMDNGSEDATASIAESFGALVHYLPEANISGLRNRGAELAKGKILAFLDADCSVTADWLKAASIYIEKPDIACFGSPPLLPYNPTWVQKTWAYVRIRKESISSVNWLESMNMFIKRDLFLSAGGFNTSLDTCEDVDISYRLAGYGSIISDSRIKAIHHGEADTIKKFFIKELWRGKSNYRGLFEHGLKLKEIPSLFLPLYFGCLGLIVIYILLFSGFLCGIYALILWQVPLILITCLKIRKFFSFTAAARLYFLYNIYYSARFLSVFK